MEEKKRIRARKKDEKVPCNSVMTERLTDLFIASVSDEDDDAGDLRAHVADMLCGELVYHVCRRRWIDAGNTVHLMEQLSLWPRR